MTIRITQASLCGRKHMKFRNFALLRVSEKHTDPDDSIIANEKLFNFLLGLERKRTERTGDPFVLVILGIAHLPKSGVIDKAMEICNAIRTQTRDTDACGWYQYGAQVGVIFTHLRKADRSAVQSALLAKVDRAICSVLAGKDASGTEISFHFFPEIVNPTTPMFHSDDKLYPDLVEREQSRPLHNVLKRMFDITGSLAFLIFFLPLLPFIALAIRISSKGPILFKQPRIGKSGREFVFYKFRTMYVDSDHKIHEEFIRKLIDKKVGGGAEETAKAAIYKIIRDPRVTPIGRFLRKSSLDEVPQFFNVLKGDMSLVGPRPPIPYELAAYRFWHRRRILEVKPGITGLWQVQGRSSTTFDEMVRLDLRYIREQSFWLDMKILLRTPRAILSGKGAY